jgi:thiol:disulfide interchange protein DsbD
MGIYLLGWFQLPHDSKLEHISVPRLMLAISSFWFVMYMVPGLWGAPLKFLSGLLPPMNQDIGVQVIGGISSAQSSGPTLPPDRKHASRMANHTPVGFSAFYDLDEALAYAEKMKKPVFIDFTGIQCTNCRQMEANVWTDPQVKKTIQENFIMVQLFGDDREPLPEMIVTPTGKKLRTLGDKWQNFVIETYKTNAMPYYAIVNSKLENLAPPRPYNLDKGAYLAFLNEGIKNYKSLTK